MHLKAPPWSTVRDALRRGLQAGAAALATHGLMRLLGLGEVYIAILSAVLILQPSVGGTIGTALTRLQATLAGSVMGLACLLLLPEGWGTAAALGLSMLVVGAMAGLRSDWSYGAVAAVAIALAPAGDMLATAWARALAIAVGAAVGVAASWLIWPDRAEARFERHLRAALRATATRVADATKATVEPGREAAPHGHVSAYHKAVGLAQEALDAAKLVDRDAMERRLDALRGLYDSLIILDRAAEADAPPAEGAEEVRRQVGRLRRDACNVLTALADGDRRSGQPLAGMDAALRRLREELAQEEVGPDLHQGRAVVAFGLREVRRALEALIEAQRGPRQARAPRRSSADLPHEVRLGPDR